ncbi:MAG: MCE family protein [Limimaricola sp.]|uniref:PqiB family protein n=1 Tax=Limimaricola sp. TaxID=2211665 RepID=UPI001DA74AB7|nr:MlaD family protein [Limimaricola sp.]MBI1417308.1 MCE family protein [Limimaricola sp.]
MTDPTPAELEISQARPSFWRNLSIVWLVPVLALVIALGVAWKGYSDRGTLIHITFENAAGVTPNETTLRFRDVVIGTVESVNFSPDLSHVIVSARVHNQVASTFTPDAQFWVVRPNVTARGITGLSTVLSGVYIEGAWSPTKGSTTVDFTGLEDPPTVQPGRKGTRVTIRARDGNLLSAGAPVFYKGIEVGQLETPHLTPAGDAVLVDAFIEAPNDKRITTATRFWDLSGFSVSLGTGGLKLDVGSLSALISGGIAFDTVFSGGSPVTDSTIFDLFDDEAAARDSIFTGVGADALDLAIEFDGSVSGLTTGAAVQYRGLRVGEVTSLGAFVEDTPSGQVVRLRATIAIDPQALGLPANGGKDAALHFLQSAVAKGLRARLSTAGLFSAALIVELVDTPDAPPAALETPANGLPVLPTTKSQIPDFTATAQGLLDRVNKLPIEEVLNQATSLMSAIEDIARADGTRATPAALAGLLTDARALINQDATQALPGELEGAVKDLRAVVDELKAQGAAAQLADAIANANTAAKGIADASQKFPDLVDSLQAVADKLNALPTDQLVASATKVLDSADAIIGTDQARALPASLTDALDQVRAALADLRAGGAIENTNAALASARNAADAVAQASATLPDLSARLDALAGRADALISSYGARSDFNAETLAALREVQSAARAVSQLARQIERNPNSLLIGK